MDMPKPGIRTHHASPNKCGTPTAVPRHGLESRPGEALLLEKLLAGMPGGGSPVEQVALGSRFAAVRASGRVGLASTLGARPNDDERLRVNGLPGHGLMNAARLLLGESDFLASVGLAALNAAYPAPADAKTESVGELMQRLSPGRRVVVVGDFPFAMGLRQVAASLDILDMRRGHGKAQAGSAAKALGSCQVAAISSTVLLTRTLDETLSAIPPDAVKVLVGPSTSWAAPLMDMGVDVLGGSVVTNSEAVFQAVAEDLPFYEIKQRGVKLAVWHRPTLSGRI